MTVKTGGYQSGKTYRWYRSMGHSSISAWCMVYADKLLVVELIILSAALGWLL